MEANNWETAVRCLEVAVRTDTSDAELIAAVNAFRRSAGDTPLRQICIEFSCGGMPLAVLAEIKDSLERLDRENRELRQKLAADEVAQAGAARRLDAAYRRIHQLTKASLAAERQADVVEPELPAGQPAMLGGGSGRLRASSLHDPHTA
jgi:hypothetical protein